MTAQRPLPDCTHCWSAGSVSNGYCMICGAPGAVTIREHPASLLAGHTPGEEHGGGGAATAQAWRVAPSGIAPKLRKR
jgi:hypothetical protein